MWLAVLQGVSFASAPLLSFGPFKIFILSSSLRDGWRRSLPLALTPLMADIPVVLLLWLVLRQLPAWSLDGLRVLGGVFYIYLAYGLVRRAGATIDAEKVDDAPPRTFWQAITAIWITPQAWINWSLIGMPALLAYGDESTLSAIGFLIGFYTIFILGLGLQIFIFGQAGKLHAKATQYIIYAASVLLVGFGIYQLWLGISSLVTPV